MENRTVISASNNSKKNKLFAHYLVINFISSIQSASKNGSPSIKLALFAEHPINDSFNYFIQYLIFFVFFSHLIFSFKHRNHPTIPSKNKPKSMCKNIFLLLFDFQNFNKLKYNIILINICMIFKSRKLQTKR